MSKMPYRPRARVWAILSIALRLVSIEVSLSLGNWKEHQIPSFRCRPRLMICRLLTSNSLMSWPNVCLIRNLIRSKQQHGSNGGPTLSIIFGPMVLAKRHGLWLLFH